MYRYILYITLWIISRYICYVGTDVSKESTTSTSLLGPFTPLMCWIPEYALDRVNKRKRICCI